MVIQKKFFLENFPSKAWAVKSAQKRVRMSFLILKTMSLFIQRGIISCERLIIALIANNRLMGYSGEIMSTYPKHSGGIGSRGNAIKIYKSNVQLYKLHNNHFKPKYKQVLTK